MIFLARNLHSVGGFSSQPCLVTRGYVLMSLQMLILPLPQCPVAADSHSSSFKPWRSKPSVAESSPVKSGKKKHLPWLGAAEYLSAFTSRPSHVGKYTIHGECGIQVNNIHNKDPMYIYILNIYIYIYVKIIHIYMCVCLSYVYYVLLYTYICISKYVYIYIFIYIIDNSISYIIHVIN